MPYVRASRPGTPDAAGPLGLSRPDLLQPDLSHPELPRAEQMSRHADVGDTMLAWERFLTGHPRAAAPACNFVVSSWQRSLALGVNPSRNSAPLLARGDALHDLRQHHEELLGAASGVVAELTELLSGSRSIMLLTSGEGVVLEAVGDLYTLGQGQEVHLMQGGDWSEGVVGTNGIGTALATGRPAQVHASEHFCEGIKRWTCAAAPVYDPATGAVLGVVDISGPPATYQRSNLALAVTIARQIEAAIAERAARDRAQLLEVCLQRMSQSDTAGLLAIDRNGRLVHTTGRLPVPVGLGQRVPGLDANLAVEDWASRLPDGWRPEWFTPVPFGGRMIGAVLVVPDRPRTAASRAGMQASEDDPNRNGFSAVIGRSAPMAAMIGRALQLARHHVPVLIEGETGVGKELVARAMHGEGGGPRPFITYNCGAASKELVAGDLFGHVRGAFTGATNEGRPGRFELAHGGTLCLDEIGEMPLDLQPVLLRVLEEGVVQRLGDTQPRRVDVRLIAITNRNLRDDVAAGRFRRDLFHRIGVTTLTVPPLRDRACDIDLLACHFNAKLAAHHGVAPLDLSAAVLDAMRAAPWPGNVRELRNVIEDSLLTGSDPAAPRRGLEGMQHDATALAPLATLRDAEQDMIIRAMREAHGNISNASRLLRISRSTLYRKLEAYGLNVEGP